MKYIVFISSVLSMLPIKPCAGAFFEQTGFDAAPKTQKLALSLPAPKQRKKFYHLPPDECQMTPSKKQLRTIALALSVQLGHNS